MYFRPPPSTVLVPLLLSCPILASFVPPPAQAQYMYLDTNGDGVHSNEDTVHPTGTTEVDLWLHTNVNRDGTMVSCPDGAGGIGLSNFDFVLTAVGGTVIWGSFTPNALHPLPCYQTAFDSSEYAAILCAPDWTSEAGLYRLGRLEVAVASGAPSLLFASASRLLPTAATAFGTPCYPGGNNSPTFGVDWFDADGARYGGWVNPPSLALPPTVVVSELASMDQVLTAADPDGPVVTFAKRSGPPFLTVGTASSAPGVAVGFAHLEPTYEDSGLYRAEITATDGVGSDFKSFRIYVANVDRAPVLDSIPAICVEQGSATTVRFHAADPDRDPVFVSARDLPPYARFTEGCAGCAYGQLDIDVPFDQPVGTTSTRILASDGSLADSQTVEVHVTELGGCSGRAPLVVRVSPNPIRSGWGELQFWTSKPGRLLVTLHDVNGRLVRTLFENSRAGAGYHRVGIDVSQRPFGPTLAAGVFFYRIEGIDGRRSGKLLVLH